MQEEKNLIRQSDSNIAPFSLDDENVYNLPTKSQVKPSQLYHSSRKELEKSNKDIQNLVEQIDKVLETHLYTWDNVNNWQFNLPSTMFTGNEAPIQFFQPKQEIGTSEMKKLTPDQCLQIKQKGEFQVQGQTEDQVTTWKINDWIIRGEEQITKSFQQALSVAWHQLLQIQCRITPKFARNYFLKSQILNPNLVDGFQTILSLFSKALNLTFGIKKVQIYSKQQVISEILKERMKATLKQHHQQMRVSFFEFVFKSQYYRDKSKFELDEKEIKQFQNAVADFNQLSVDFDKWASKYETEKIKELEKSDKSEDEALMEIFQEKQNYLFNLIQSGTYVKEKDVQQHLINLIQATQITNRQYYELNKQINEKEAEKIKEIKEKHPIKSRVELWKSRVVKEQMQPIIEKLVVDCNQKILKDLTQANLKSEVILFVRFTEFQQAFKQIYNDNYKRIQQQSTTPCRVFSTFQKYMPPYKIIQSKDYNGVTFYQYENGKEYKTNTDFFGWRVVLQVLRYKVWTINVFINLTQNLINGQFGLKSLFYTQPFSRGTYVEYRTGEEKNYGYFHPYVYILKTTLNGIKKTMEDFEALPDRGLFGKNFARGVKYIECYVFRLLFVAIFLVGILMPIVIILNCLFSFALAITSWLWIPITLVFRWLYHIFVWDFDSPTRHSQIYYPYDYLRYQTFERLPIVKASFDLIVGLFEIIVSIISMIFIHPLIAVLSVIFAYLRKILTSISDEIMFFVTKKIGRQPEIDTFIAWKVRGSGVTRQYSYSMDIEDVKFLMRSHLESTELEEYNERLRQRIQGPQSEYEEFSRSLFKNYDLQQGSSQFISQNIAKLQSILSKQIQDRKKKYPNPPNCNIKFTQEELSAVFYECESMSRQFIEQRKMSWVFKKYDIEENDFKSITEKFLIAIFNDPNILYPINELDKRIEIQTVKKQQFNSISNAIKGEGSLKNFQARIQQRFQKFKKQILFPFISSSQVKSFAYETINDRYNYIKNQDPSNVTYFYSSEIYENATQQKQESSKKQD
ncbi:transmembrane protein, putative (macronuclear) [Tetrahymena thermophila SB210]|uniref:Transmembrane protein, putative n=1 Tax=Tetrahymena thermophila (strain SB210) TaxID=312017 RepID=Q23G24_TETTS|nr:transmembrane protein, putative [Tetrahymena thermophila SB210]EAR95436.1 transmembrane protein, putative [Tetrahymena thermophila SB210]|eukprot:XP_001015681.1 transmembrane protein, putative [Tetrahymena thermophila SB210]